MTPERVLATIAHYRFNFVSESDLHDALAILDEASACDWLSALEEVAGWPTDAIEVYIWRPSMWDEITAVLR
jgi:hypothetical protein